MKKAAKKQERSKGPDPRNTLSAQKHARAQRVARMTEENSEAPAPEPKKPRKKDLNLEERFDNLIAYLRRHGIHAEAADDETDE